MVAVLAAGVAGCRGGSLTELEGVYSISTWTESSTSCDAEGPSVAAQRSPSFYLKAESFFGEDFVNVKSCDSDAECRMLATEEDTIHIGEFTFDDGSDADGWSSGTATGFELDGSCMGLVSESKLTATGEQIRIEVRRIDVPPFAPDAQNECPDEAVAAAAAGQPCTDLEVVTGARTGGF